MRIPSQSECFQLMTRMRMLDHIAAHCLMVRRVAVLLTDHLERQGAPLRRDLVASAALLHDITKPRSLTTGENHAATGGELMRDLGFPEVGRIVAQHVVLDGDADTPFPTEAEIVNYADKRVIEDRIVTLAVRMDYILARYGRTPALKTKLQVLWDRTVELEQKIFAPLAFAPEALAAHTDGRQFAADYAGYLRHTQKAEAP
jgi:putative nucleotidyltransferase with HDIG domain